MEMILLILIQVFAGDAKGGGVGVTDAVWSVGLWTQPAPP